MSPRAAGVRRKATLAQMFLMSDGTVETKLSTHDGIVPYSFILEQLELTTARLQLALKNKEV